MDSVLTVLILIAAFIFIFLGIKNKTSTKKRRILYLVIGIGLVVFWIGSLLGLWDVAITYRAEDSHVIYSVLNGLMSGGMLVLLGFSMSMGKLSYRLILLIVILIFSLLGGGYIGFQIYISFFAYPYWASNTPDGLLFFAGNWYWIVTIVILSFITEAEISIIDIGGKSNEE